MDRGTLEGHVTFKKTVEEPLREQSSPKGQRKKAYEDAMASARKKHAEAQVKKVIIRKADDEEWELARDLAFRTYEEFNEGDYSAEGKHNFHGYLFDPLLKEMFVRGQMQLFVAEYDDEIVGMIGLKHDSHISLLFVEGAVHRQGIGGALVDCAAQYARNQGVRALTVHSSLYARDFYHSMNFKDTGIQTMQDGIRFVPMELKLL